jgi:hypothetical protein
VLGSSVAGSWPVLFSFDCVLVEYQFVGSSERACAVLKREGFVMKESLV